MDAGAIYELVYPARDPMVLGIGSGHRDLVTFLRYDTADRSGAQSAERPAAGALRAPLPAQEQQTADVVILEGISQSGRVVRDFIHQGFNVDTQSRQVFNGAMPLIAGSRRVWMNDRFAQPGRCSKEHEEHFQVGDQFPFTYPVMTDAVQWAAWRYLCPLRSSRSCPKLMHIDGSASEFWQRRVRLVGADGRGQDIEMPTDVRLYLADRDTLYPNGKVRAAGLVFAARQCGDELDHARAVCGLVDWVAQRRVAPPASQWPQAARNELADPRDMAHGLYPICPNWVSDTTARRNSPPDGLQHAHADCGPG
ncbi:MAG: alpha/beta hydrolase domain-containing protein [Ideonella sp.]|nr:alpha/beta hydrolase domain-containing protein [Ideonella sp.]